MDFGIISVRYARALLKSATDQKLEDQVYQEMQTLAKSFIDVPALRQTIDNPMLSKDKKQELLETAAGQKLSSLTKGFIALVLKEDRESPGAIVRLDSPFGWHCVARRFLFRNADILLLAHTTNRRPLLSAYIADT